MPSITSWLRLEPRSRDAAMDTSLQARIYDPLWLLARQWQFGEFEGEDNGSPVMTHWHGEAAPLTRYQLGATSTQTNAPKYDGAHLPLEALVERETVRPRADQVSQPEKLRFAAEAGQHFLRLLDLQPLKPDVRARYRAAFIREYGFQPLSVEQRKQLDGNSLAFLDLMTGRVPDGRRLAVAFRPTAGGEIALAPALQIDEGDRAEVEKAARLWLQWSNNLFSEPEANDSAWLPERMEYAFSVGARFSDGERVLTAPEYYEGRLDWYAFDSNFGAKLGTTADAAVKTPPPHTAIPAPAGFRGMPAARFWEFEDAQVNFGAVDAGPADLLRVLLVEFALSYGNDWFVIPLELEVGSLYRTTSLIVTDSFGERTSIRPASELPGPFSSWRMFQQSPLRGSTLPQSPSNQFFLPPALVKSLEGKPIEEVLFLRDEMANMAWGVERVIESASEQPLNRFEQKREPLPSSAPAAAATPIYKLATETPDYWVPLVPVKKSDGLRLKRAKVLRLTGDEEFVEAHGEILDGGANNSGEIFEEEIPREGVRVTRAYQLARWHDGSTHLWIGRRKRVGSGEGSSGLRFDSLFTR